MRSRRAGSTPAIRRSPGFILLCASLALGCGDAPQVPVTRGDRLLVPGTELAAAVVYDVTRRAIVRRVGPPLNDLGFVIYDSPSASLFVVGRVASGDEVLLELDARNAAERRRHVLSRDGVALRSNGVAFGRLAAALDPERRLLYVWNSERGGLFGVAVLDLETGAAIDFRQVALRRGGVVAIPPGAGFPEGGIVVYGDNGNADFSRAVLYFLGGAPLAVRDSIILAPPSRRVLQVEVAKNGRELLVGTNAQILRIDVRSRGITAVASRPNGGRVARSPADGRLFLAAPGSTDLPTPNLVHVLTPDLELAGVIDLRSLPESERPLAIAGSVVSPDGRFLYLVSGVSRNGPVLYGPQETSIVVIDAATMRIEGVHALGTFGTGAPQLTR